MPAGRSPGYANDPAGMRPRHDAQCPPLQLCGRFRPARSAAASTFSAGSAAKLWRLGMIVIWGMDGGCHAMRMIGIHDDGFA
jgi:hypothetical protein